MRHIERFVWRQMATGISSVGPDAREESAEEKAALAALAAEISETVLLERQRRLVSVRSTLGAPTVTVTEHCYDEAERGLGPWPLAIPTAKVPKFVDGLLYVHRLTHASDWPGLDVDVTSQARYIERVVWRSDWADAMPTADAPGAPGAPQTFKLQLSNHNVLRVSALTGGELLEISKAFRRRTAPGESMLIPAERAVLFAEALLNVHRRAKLPE